MWTVLAGCFLLPSAPPEPAPLGLAACEDVAPIDVAAPEAPPTLEASAAAAPRVPADAPTAVRLPDGLHDLPEAAAVGWDDASEATAIDGGLLLCRLEQGLAPRFRLTVGDQPPIEGVSPVPRLLSAAPLSLEAGQRLTLEVSSEDGLVSRADATWTPGRTVTLSGRAGLRAACRSLPREALADATDSALARLDEARARACGPVSPGPTEVASLEAALEREVRQVAALAGWADPRLAARRAHVDELRAQLRDEVRVRMADALSDAVPAGRSADLVSRAARVEVTREASCARRLPAGHPAGVRCTVEVDVVHQRGQPIRLVGGWDLRLGDAFEVAMVTSDGVAHPVTGATFLQDGRPVRSEILSLEDGEGALVEMWIDLQDAPPDGGPPLLRLSDGSRTTWLRTRL
jgi:hypothetical protein